MAEALKKFGKYFLLDLIAQGGMAEIYRARMGSNDGGGRLLAIKRIISSYSQNPEFVTMFKSEIKTTSGFTHPNIVQLYDYGEDQGMLYIAMEFVDGKNLRQFISRFAELKSMFPIEVSVYILEQAALGMAYAHSFKDKFSGKSLNIVHRDISPQNLLISYDGAVKVIDFGIAKAVTNVESTRSGVIKGKPSYLSPEQITGEVLDGRSDLFALGIVLWELLTGKKLFASDNDYGVLKLIENCTSHVKPPSLYNPKVPKDLDAIVMKCLKKNRDDRYSTAEEMQRALHKFLYQFAPDFNPADLAYYARDLFKNEIVEDRKRLTKLNDRAEQLLLEHAKAPPVPQGTATAVNKSDEIIFAESTIALNNTQITDKSISMPSTQKEKTNVKGQRVLSMDSNVNIKLDRTRSAPGDSGSISKISKTKFLQTPNQDQKKSRSPFAAVLIVGAALAGYFYLNQDTTSNREVAQDSTELAVLVVQGNVKAATVTLDDKPVGNALPTLVKNLPTDKPLKLVVTANGFSKFTQEVTLKKGEKRNVVAELQRVDGTSSGVDSTSQEATKGPQITLRVSVSPPGLGTQIRINGTSLDVSGVTNVGLNTPLDVIVEREGFRTVRKNLTVQAADLAGKPEYVLNVTLEQAKFGYLSIKTTPSAEAYLSIDGVEEKWSTPVSRKRLPVGQYKAKLVNALLGMEKEVTFTINEDRFTNIEERLSIVDESAGRVPGSKR